MAKDELDTIINNICYLCAKNDIFRDPSLSTDERLMYVVEDVTNMLSQKFGDDMEIVAIHSDEVYNDNGKDRYLLLRYGENKKYGAENDDMRINRFVPWKYSIEYVDKNKDIHKNISFNFKQIKNEKRLQDKELRNIQKANNKPLGQDISALDDIDIAKNYVYGDSISEKSLNIHNKKSKIFSILNSYEFDDFFDYLKEISYMGEDIPSARNANLLRKCNFATVDNVKLQNINDSIGEDLKEEIKHSDTLTAFRQLKLGKKKSVYSNAEYEKMLDTKSYIFRNNKNELTLSEYLNEVMPKIQQEMIYGDTHNRVHTENIIAVGANGELYKFKKITNITVKSDDVSFSVSLWNFPSDDVVYGHGLVRYDTLGDHDNAVYNGKLVSGGVIKKGNTVFRPANNRLGEDANKFYHEKAMAPHLHIMDPIISTTYLCKVNHTGNAVNIGNFMDFADKNSEENVYTKNHPLIKKMLNQDTLKIFDKVKKLDRQYKTFEKTYYENDLKRNVHNKKYDSRYFSLVKNYIVSVGDDMINDLFCIDPIPKNEKELTNIIEDKKKEITQAELENE